MRSNFLLHSIIIYAITAGCYTPSDIASEKQASTITFTAQLRGRPAGLAAGADEVWVAEPDINVLENVVFDPSLNVYRVVIVVGEMPGRGPQQVVILPPLLGKESLAWTNSVSNDLNAFNFGLDREVFSIQSGDGPGAIINCDQELCVANANDNTISIHTGFNDHQLFKKVPVGASPVSMAFDGKKKRLFVVNAGDGTISVLQETPTVDWNLLTIIQLGHDTKPRGVSINATTRKLWVALEAESRIVRVDLDDLDHAPSFSLPVGHHPYGLTANAATDEVFVTDVEDNLVSVIDTAFNRIERVVPVGPQPVDVAVTRSGDVYVSNSGDETLTVFRDPGFTAGVVKIPIRWCVINGTRWASAGALRTLLNRVNDEHYLVSGARVLFQAVPRDPLPAIQSEIGNPTETVDGVALHTRGLLSECDQAWGAEAGNGTAVLVSEEIINTSAIGYAITPNAFTRAIDGTPGTRSADVCTHPRDRIQTGDLLHDVAVLQSPQQVHNLGSEAGGTTAHEFGHLLLLDHGNGVDDDHNGLEPPTPGIRSFDASCDPGGTDSDGHPREDTSSVCSVMEPSDEGANCQLFQPLQVEQVQDIAPVMPGAVGSADPAGIIVNDGRCAPPACALPPEIAIEEVSVSELPGSGVTVLTHNLLGDFPSTIHAEYSLLIDLDNNPGSGCNPASTGIESTFVGADLATRVTVTAGSPLPHAVSEVWLCRNGAFVHDTGSGGSVQAFQMTSSDASSSGAGVVSLHLPNSTRGPMADHVRVQAFSRQLSGSGAVDRLPHANSDEGALLDLRVRDLPSCVAERGAIRPGEAARVSFTGLPPNLPVAVSLFGGPSTSGTSDNRGDGVIEFIVPSNTRSGLRLLSVDSSDGITSAACAIEIAGDRATPATTANLEPAPSFEGWNSSDVTAHLVATASAEGAEVQTIEYSASGAQPISATFSPGSSVSLLFTQEGITDVLFQSVDAAGIRETQERVSVKIDKTFPVIMGSVDPPANALGWNRTPVNISFTCTDDRSGIAGCTLPTTISDEGRGIVQIGKAIDRAQNQASLLVTINLDRTPPLLNYINNKNIYAVDEIVNITCTASDSLSGLASSSCAPISGPAYAFPLGVNHFSAIATDFAENSSLAEVSFQVKVTYASLCNLAIGFSSTPGIAHSLCSKLESAQAAEQRGNKNAKEGSLGAFRNEVSAQSGKSLSVGEAAILTHLVGGL